MTRTIVIAAALALAVILPTESAQAQSPRTFVSAAGSDSNPCSFAAPCRHFQAAVNATSLGGEVDALDPAGYGPIIIIQAITIEGQGWSYIAPPASGNGITINAVSGNVSIHGVSLNGVGVAGFTTGIQFNSGGSLNVQNCMIRNFSNNGIVFISNTSAQLFISNALVSDNGGDGISIVPTGSGTTTGVLDLVQIENNANEGLLASTNTQTIKMTVTDSVSSDNTNVGIYAQSLGGTPVTIMVRNSTSANNGGDGLEAQGTGASIRVTRSTITGNGTGWETSSSGVVTSYGDNNIDGNAGGNSAPPSIGYK
jgi:hypothetical protein